MCLGYTWFCKLSIAKVTVYYLSPQSLQSGFQTKELVVINKYGSCQISLCFVKPLFQIIKVPPPMLRIFFLELTPLDFKSILS